MGVVYKAEDTKLKRFVALKFLPPELTCDPDAKQRFIHEAQAASALEHNNICNIHEIDEIPIENRNQTFIVMACYEGEILKDKIQRGPFKIDEAIDLTIQMAQGLEMAHRKGIVHRDIKPGNIIVTEEGVVKILDFGLAKLAGKTKLTKEQTTLGTVAYMSPEQAEGEDVDHRTDIWSLGVILYEMITGQRPFRGEYDQAVVYSIMNEETKPLTGIRTDVPVSLENVVNKCLEKDRFLRYQHADGLISDLRRLKRDTTKVELTTSIESMGSAKSEMPSPTGQRPLSARTVFFRKRWILFTAPIVLTAVVVAGWLYFKNKKASSPFEKKLVVLPFENLGSPDDEYFSDGLTDAITARLAVIKGLGVISRTTAIQYKNTKKRAPEIAKELGVDYILEGTVQRERPSDPASRVRIIPQLISGPEDRHVWADSYEEDMSEVFRIQSDIAEQVAQALDITLLEPERRMLEDKPTDNVEAYEFLLRGNDYYFRISEENTRIAIGLYEKAVDLDPDFGIAYACIARARSLLYWLFRKVDDLPKAKEALDEAVRLDPDHTEVHLAQGRYHMWCSLDLERALEEFLIVNRHQPSNTYALRSIGDIQHIQGKWEMAIANYEMAQELDPRDYLIHVELAEIYDNLRQYEKAEFHYDRVNSLAPDISLYYLMKASFYLRWDGATKRARAVIKEIPQSNHPYSIWSLILMDVADGQYDQALKHISSLPTEFIELGTVLFSKTHASGIIFKLMNKQELARVYLDSARIIFEKEAKVRPGDPTIHSTLGLVYADLGLREDAIHEGETAMKLRPVSMDAEDGPVFVETMSWIYATVGEVDAALDQIEYLLSIPFSLSRKYIKIEPRYIPLRSHPRFQKLSEGGK